MKIYQIWRKGNFNSAGFSEEYDEPTQKIYSTYELAEKNCPEGLFGDRFSGFRRYYIKEIEIE